MMFASTRTSSDRVTFAQGIFRGLAPDGGLYHPVEHPDLSGIIGSFGPKTAFQELAVEIIYALLGDELRQDDAERIAHRAFGFSPKVVPLAGQLNILELFHGPSCAFKDFGASFLAASMEHFLSARDRHAVILTATSGDTGSAVAQAFHEVQNISVVILYPSGRVSPLQEKQLTTVGGNVHAVEVEGSFDDCQRLVKEAFVDRRLTDELSLTSANSINLGRLLPQAFYYLYGAAQVRDISPNGPVFCVPSGNFGNLTAGVLAWRWGMRAARFIATTNANDVVPQYLASGIFSPRPSVQTLSNAMDVGNPSNFERLAAIFGGDAARMREQIEGSVVTDVETLETIARYYRDTGVFLDPHTATGVLAAERYLDRVGSSSPILCLATAHPGKFLEVVEAATGVRPKLPLRLEESLSREKVAVRMGDSLDDLRDYLLDTFRYST